MARPYIKVGLSSPAVNCPENQPFIYKKESKKPAFYNGDL